MIIEFNRLKSQDIHCMHCGKKIATWHIQLAGHCCLCDGCVKLVYRATNQILTNPPTTDAPVRLTE